MLAVAGHVKVCPSRKLEVLALQAKSCGTSLASPKDRGPTTPDSVRAHLLRRPQPRAQTNTHTKVAAGGSHNASVECCKPVSSEEVHQQATGLELYRVGAASARAQGCSTRVTCRPVHNNRAIEHRLRHRAFTWHTARLFTCQGKGQCSEYCWCGCSMGIHDLTIITARSPTTVLIAAHNIAPPARSDDSGLRPYKHTRHKGGQERPPTMSPQWAFKYALPSYEPHCRTAVEGPNCALAPGQAQPPHAQCMPMLAKAGSWRTESPTHLQAQGGEALGWGVGSTSDGCLEEAEQRVVRGGGGGGSMSKPCKRTMHVTMLCICRQ